MSAVVGADAPLTHECALADLRAILYAAQHARSTFRENGWEDDTDGLSVGKQLLEGLYPWLYGRGCIVVPLNGLIQRCEANGGRVPAGDYINFLRAAKQTPAIMMGVMMNSRRELPDLTPMEVVGALGLDL